MLFDYVLRIVRKPDEVEDIIQETYLHLLRESTKCGSTYRSPRAMIMTVARRIAIDWIRHQQYLGTFTVPDVDEIEVPDDAADVESTVHASHTLEEFCLAAERLPPRCREVFLLRKVYGLSQKELALRLGITENTVEQHLAKAVRRLPELIERVRLGSKRAAKALEKSAPPIAA